MKFLVTGCAGFIGSNLVDKLLSLNYEVIGIDNFSTGKNFFLLEALKNKDFTLINSDLNQIDQHKASLKGIDLVYHLAANADVRFGFDHPFKDLNENTINTLKLLEVMRILDIKNIIFSSTGAVYGDAKVIPTKEDYSFPIQTSLYATSKVAAEGLISSYCERYKFNAAACRFVSLMGPRYTHGHVVDFVNSLKKDNTKLTILGNGKQYKSYFHVDDCINALILLFKKLESNAIKGFFPINLGTEDGIKVEDSAKIICETLNVQPKFIFTGGERGWVGDNPNIQLDISKAKQLGWKPCYTIKESIKHIFLSTFLRRIN